MKIFGTGRVWDPSRHEVAWEFPKAPRGELGCFETDDPLLIALAKLNGFVMDGVEPVAKKPVVAAVSEDTASDAPKPPKPPKAGK